MAKKDDRRRTCPTCNRTGIVYKNKARLKGKKMTTEETIEVCPQCGGDGTVPA